MSDTKKTGTPKDSHYARLRRAYRDEKAGRDERAAAPPAHRPRRKVAPGEGPGDGLVHLYGLHTVRAALANLPARAGSSFLWPVQGPLLSSFGAKAGGKHNDGINIAAPAGTPVRAADNGVVAYAGNELRGFGNLLLIRHADGWMSAYAHNETLLVQRGDNVVRGQTIARVGQTGNVSRPQLHFELRRGAEAVDPMEYLGELGAALPPGAISPDAGRDVPPSPG